MKSLLIKNKVLMLLLIVQLAVGTNLFAQNIAINTTGNTPDTSAMLDITSTKQGFLMPRMTTAQMNAIVLPATGLLIYNTSLSVFEVNIGTSAAPNWVPLSTTQTGWNTAGNSGTNSNNNFLGTTDNTSLNIRTNNQNRIKIDSIGNVKIDSATLTVDAVNNRVGISNATPTQALDVTGNVKFSGALMPNNNAGTSGQILVSAGAGASPNWTTINTVSGTLASSSYVQGTSAATINQGNTGDVPGDTITIVVPTGKTQTVFFTIQGYAIRSVTTPGQSAQGVFSLLQNGTKISSAFASSGDGGVLYNLPAPVTFLKSVTLTGGTYTFKVQYSAWSGNQIVNNLPTGYTGYSGDTECMLTKMLVMVYNN